MEGESRKEEEEERVGGRRRVRERWRNNRVGRRVTNKELNEWR